MQVLEYPIFASITRQQLSVPIGGQIVGVAKRNKDNVIIAYVRCDEKVTELCTIWIHVVYGSNVYHCEQPLRFIGTVKFNWDDDQVVHLFEEIDHCLVGGAKPILALSCENAAELNAVRVSLEQMRGDISNKGHRIIDQYHIIGFKSRPDAPSIMVFSEHMQLSPIQLDVLKEWQQTLKNLTTS